MVTKQDLKNVTNCLSWSHQNLPGQVAFFSVSLFVPFACFHAVNDYHNLNEPLMHCRLFVIFWYLNCSVQWPCKFWFLLLIRNKVSKTQQGHWMEQCKKKRFKMVNSQICSLFSYYHPFYLQRKNLSSFSNRNICSSNH